ncbi:hypothetical protein ABPG75_004227 [Micractinium tetrahymenae]
MIAARSAFCIPAQAKGRYAASAWRELRRAAVRARQRRQLAATAAAGQQQGQHEAPPLRVAVIGGGFAGLAASYHLLAAAGDSGRAMQLTLYDAVGLGAGGSGAAAGLLHPYTPRGKMLWQGLAAFQDALQLLEAAEAAVQEASSGPGSSDTPAGSLQTAAGPIRWPLAWRHGMLRPARSAKQARDIARFLPKDAHAAAATQAEAIPDAASLAALVPGLKPQLLLAPEELQAAAAAPQQAQQPASKRRRPQAQQQQQAARPPALGLMVHAGVTIHPASYMRALWLACQAAAARGAAGSAASLALQPVTSLRQLQAAAGPFDAVVVAAGAAVGSIEELQGRLPLDLCQGYSLDMSPAGSSRGRFASGGAGGTSASTSGSSSDSGRTSGSSGSAGQGDPAGSGSGSGGGSSDLTSSSDGGGYPAGAPSLLGSPYIAAHGSDSLVMGATKRYGLSWQEAYCQLSAPLVQDAAEVEAAAAALLPGATQLWPPLAGWRVSAVRSGVRALPLRGSDGSIPYAGRLPLEAGAGSASGSGGNDANNSSTGSTSGSGSSNDSSRGSSSSHVVPGDGASQDAAGHSTAAACAAPSGPSLPPCWVIGGLGARGLVYHAWLGRLVAAAVLAGSEAGLPAELLRWREPGPVKKGGQQ